jgi:hypothetical protein
MAYSRQHTRSPAIEVRNMPTSRNRRLRRPSYAWNGQLVPFTIQPVLIAPMLPGDSLKSGMFQTRAITAPVSDRLAGWWLETFFFYVKISDMDDGQALLPLLVDPAASPVNDAAAATHNYFAGGMDRGIDWVSRALRPVVRAYFRDDDEQPEDYEIGPRYAAGLSGSYWWATALDDVPDTTPDDPTEWEGQWKIYQDMRTRKLTTATYQEWLAQYGVQAPPDLTEAREDLRVPELVRFTREWQYPSNIVDAESGTVQSAVSWTVAEKLSRARFFGEPGFLLGLQVVRPKVLSSVQHSHAASMLTDAHAWMPPVFEDDPHAAIRVFDGDNSEGVITTDQEYALDLRKPWLKGDQMLLGSAGGYRFALPDFTGNLKYPSAAMVESLWADSEYPGNGVDVDGVAQLQIASRVSDRTH